VGGGVFLGVAVGVGVGAAALSWAQARRAAAPTRGDPVALALALRRLPPSERLGELLRRARPGSWEHELAAEALSAPGEAARVSAMNLALAEVEHVLTRGAGWPGTGLRIALLGASLCAFAAYFAEGGRIQWSLSILGVGAVAALACVEAGRISARNAMRQRRAIDDLVAVAFGDAPSASAATKPAGAAGRATAARRARRRR
jgi:hypothetical protein